MNESGFWTVLRRLLPHGHFTRIENPLEPGTPDVNYCVERIEGWLELKYNVRAPLGDRGLRPAQKIWAQERMEQGGRIHAAVGIKRCLFFIEPEFFPTLNDWALQDFYDYSVSYTEDRFDASLVERAFFQAVR